jgi:hypothetical protein
MQLPAYRSRLPWQLEPWQEFDIRSPLQPPLQPPPLHPLQLSPRKLKSDFIREPKPPQQPLHDVP